MSSLGPAATRRCTGLDSIKKAIMLAVITAQRLAMMSKSPRDIEIFMILFPGALRARTSSASSPSDHASKHQSFPIPIVHRGTIVRQRSRSQQILFDLDQLLGI